MGQIKNFYVGQKLRMLEEQQKDYEVCLDLARGPSETVLLMNSEFYINEGGLFAKPNIPNQTIMGKCIEKAKRFVREKKLSKDEKLMVKHGLMDIDRDFTCEAEEIFAEEERCERNERMKARMIELAKEMEAEEKDEKKK